MKNKFKAWNIFSWFIGAVFFTLGILNVFLIHPVPGVFYLLLSIFYIPPFNDFLIRKIPFTISKAVKVIVAAFILWATLAVGDLMELFESRYL